MSSLLSPLMPLSMHQLPAILARPGMFGGGKPPLNGPLPNPMIPPSMPGGANAPRMFGNPMASSAVGDALPASPGAVGAVPGHNPLTQADAAPFLSAPPFMDARPPAVPMTPLLEKKKGPFSKGGDGWKAVGILGDAIATASGGKAMYLPYAMDQMSAKNERNWAREKLQLDIDARREEAERKARDPRIEQVGNTIGWLNPGEGSFNPFYTAPQPFESYAKALGYQPGTEDYEQAVRDYRLGAWSDPAMENKTEFEGIRQGNRKALQDDRLRTTRRGQDIRSTDTRRGQDIRATTVRRGQDIGANRKAVKVRSIEQARALPPGTVFITPDGRTKVR